MRQLILRKEIKPIVSSLFISLVAGFAMNILILAAIMISNAFSGKYMNVLNELALLISIAGVPYILYTKVLGYEAPSLDKKKIIKDLWLYIAIGIILLFFFEKNAVLHFIVIAVAEEIHFRWFQYGYLEKNIGSKNAIIISSIIFAFVLHLNDNLILNLIIRLPLGIVLCLINNRFGIGKSIASHWIYDVIASSI